jgi:hypothetical protein
MTRRHVAGFAVLVLALSGCTAAPVDDGTERDSRRIVTISPAGDVTRVRTVDEAVPDGEGGLLGVAVSPVSPGGNLDDARARYSGRAVQKTGGGRWR